MKRIPEDTVAEFKKIDMCLKCGKCPDKCFESYAKNSIVTGTVLTKGRIPQVRDTSNKQQRDDVNISTVSMDTDNNFANLDF